MMSYASLSQVPFENLAATERKRASVDHARSQSIIMMNQLEKKYRITLEKRIEKKLEKAGKNL